MAKLHSEDQDCPSALVISAGPIKELVGEKSETQSWQNVEIEFISGQRSHRTLENEDSLLCRTPADEIKDLYDALIELADGQRSQILFEPSEPSFEINLERTARGGIKVQTWLDAGNGTTGIYTWDACGVRFYTTTDKLKQFAGELKTEFRL